MEVVGNKAFYGATTIPETVSVFTSRYSYRIAGRTSKGYNFKVKVHKTDRSNTSLSGPVFEVVPESDNKVVGTITTDTDGMRKLVICSATLIFYVLAAPAGYDRLTEDITIQSSRLW